MTYKPWTHKELERLEIMRLNGRTVAEIAFQLDRTPGAIRGALYNSGVCKPLGMALEVADLLTAPHTIQGIAKRFGVQEGTVYAWKTKLRRMGYAVMRADYEDEKRTRHLRSLAGKKGRAIQLGRKTA